VQKPNKVKTSIYLPDDLFWRLKKAVLDRRITDVQAYEDAVRQWVDGPPIAEESSRKAPAIPRALATTIDWLIDLYARKGTPEQEALKSSIRVLVARREAEQKR
jgi:hypothetical protein